MHTLENKKDISPETLHQWLTADDGTQPPAEAVAGSEAALLALAAAQAMPPRDHTRTAILDKLRLLNAQQRQRRPIDPNHLPLLEPDANWIDWEAAVAGIRPPDAFDNIHLHTLESNDRRDLFVVWVKEMVPEEVHHDLLESFILLDGACECFITDENGNERTVRMHTGDYIAFRLGEVHDIRITSATPAKAILQWLKPAA